MDQGRGDRPPGRWGIAGAAPPGCCRHPAVPQKQRLGHQHTDERPFPANLPGQDGKRRFSETNTTKK